MILEARDRLGGRTWTSQFASRPIEMGGMSIHWFQPHVWSEVSRYGLPVVEAETHDSWVQQAGSKLVSYPLAEATERDRRLYERFLSGLTSALPRPYEPLFQEKEIAALDRLSLRDRLNQLQLTQEEDDWLSGPLSDLAGGSLEDASLVSLLRWFALAGWSYDLLWEAHAAYRLPGGTRALVDAMVSDAPVEVRLSHPVAELVQDEGGVRVTTRDGEVVDAALAVIAVPANVWPSLVFSPPLEPVRLDAARQGFSAPHLVKIWAHVRGNTDRVRAQWPEGSPITRIRSEGRLDDGQLIVGFSNDPTFDGADEAVIERTVQEVWPGSRLVDVVTHDWGTDEFSRGGHPYLRTGLHGRLSTMQQNLGRLFFATSDIANGWHGFIDGAIESGITAASRALRAGHVRPAHGRDDTGVAFADGDRWPPSPAIPVAKETDHQR